MAIFDAFDKPFDAFDKSFDEFDKPLDAFGKSFDAFNNPQCRISLQIRLMCTLYAIKLSKTGNSVLYYRECISYLCLATIRGQSPVR